MPQGGVEEKSPASEPTSRLLPMKIPLLIYLPFTLFFFFFDLEMNKSLTSSSLGV